MEGEEILRRMSLISGYYLASPLFFLIGLWWGWEIRATFLPIYAMPGELMAMGEEGIPYSVQEVLVNGGLAGSFFLVGFYRAQRIILARPTSSTPF